MKLVIFPCLVLFYLYFSVAENVLVQVNDITERVERTNNRNKGRSPAIAYSRKQ